MRNWHIFVGFCVLFPLPAFAQTVSSPNIFPGSNLSLGNITANGYTQSAGTWLTPFFNTPNSFSLTNPIASSSSPNFSTYTSVSGSDSTGAFFAPNVMQTTGDTLNYTGQNYGSTLHLDHNFGGSAMKGSRANLDLSMIMQATTGNLNNTASEYVGIGNYVSCGYSDNGSAGFANASGDCVGANNIAALGGTYYYTVNSEEDDVSVTSGSSVAHAFGLLIVKEGPGPQGTYDDAAIDFANNTATWKNILQIGKTDGTSGTDSNTTILACVSQTSTGTPCPVKNGIDLRNFTGATGGYAFASPGLVVDWSGNITPNSLIASAVTAPGAPVASLAITAGGGGFSSFPTLTIAAPSAGVQATGVVSALAFSAATIVSGGTGYSVNDVLTFVGGTHSSAAQVYVSSVSSGVITGVGGYAAGSYTVLPSNPVSVTGGTGSGATFNLSYYVLTGSVTGAGSGYTSAPAVTISGGGGYSATATATLGTGNALSLTALSGITTTGPFIQGGTKFTTTGCSISSTTGNGTAGTYTSGTSGACAAVITMNGATGMTAPNGWNCFANDWTTPTDAQAQTGTTTTTATISGTTVSGDVVHFACRAY